MTGLSVLLLGLGLGVRHAMDADHVVVVSTLVSREPGRWRAARVAALWGAGHTLAFLGLGLLVVLARLQVPPAFERLAEILVAGLLIGFGAWHLVRSFDSSGPEDAAPAVVARPIVIGVAHGLAGSSGVALLAATTIASRPLAAGYLCLVALGTVLGMVVLTVVMAGPIAWTMRREGVVKRAVVAVSGGVGVALGAWLLLRLLAGAH
ncbi:Nickel transporter UreH [Labilithrix luteola]|uniref:Nickel transporter UreH n=1 Tax=Labilithrix luteola TaxID=1391654 RepID=A0A0K1QFB1_9BACT|nr:hypothetical protein [Labilithrix luteola]AKV04449.1 Nickel transporter UreH [Labilithrix luteola]